MDKKYCSGCSRHRSREGGFDVIRKGKVVRWRCSACQQVAVERKQKEPTPDSDADK
jgi:hypothetical protein